MILTDSVSEGSRGPWLAAGFCVRGCPGDCSCLCRRCDFRGCFEEREAAEDPASVAKDRGTVVIARVQRHVSSPQVS